MSRKLKLTCLELIQSSAGLGTGEVGKALWLITVMQWKSSVMLIAERCSPLLRHIVIFIAFIYL